MVLTKIKKLFSKKKKKPLYEASIIYDDDSLEEKMYFDSYEGAESWVEPFEKRQEI